jgi:hypothetical protein
VELHWENGMSKRKKAKTEFPRYVTVEEAMHTLRVAPLHMKNWVREGRVELFDTSEGKAIRWLEFKKSAHSQEARAAALEGLANETARRESDDVTGLSQQFKNEIAQLVQEYYAHIDTLERIHRKYHNQLDVLSTESSIVAAYIIFSKILTLLRMTCVCLDHHYWDAMALLRSIDEAVLLAEYFATSGNTTQGKKHLEEWFRENRSPSNSVCREAIDKFFTSLPPGQEASIFGSAMRNLYQAKSKPVHNTLNDIMEVYRTRLENGKLLGVGFDYGPCSYPRKMLGLVHFFRSSIWTTAQSFQICFQLAAPMLDREDIDTLFNLNLRFLSEINRGREFL